MKRSNAALAVLVAGALTCGIGCGDGGSKAGASAEPAKSGAAASSAGTKSSGAQAKTSGAPAASGAPKADPGAGATASADVLKHMPKDCNEGRVFVNLGKLLAGGDLGSSVDTLLGKAMSSGKADDKKAAEVMKTLKDGGIDPVKDIREIAVCANKDKKKTVVAISMEPKADKPADVFAKAAEVGDGKPPTKEEKDGATFLKSATGNSAMAVIGKNMLLMGDDQAFLAGLVKGGDGSGDFGDSKSHIVWAKVDPDKSKADVMMKEAGSDYDLKVMFVAGKEAPKMKEQFEKSLPELDKMAEKMAFVKPLLPVAKNGKIEVAGDNLTFTTKFPKATIGQFLTEASKADPKEIMKGLKF